MDIERRPPRICLCVLMNHPFPSILPLLRRIYAGRFTYVRFLIPFERMADEDVITVYRGSYSHSAYLTDAYHELADLDVDYVIAVHDDVLLNPRISEETFFSTFGKMGPDDGFIAEIGQPTPGLGDWIWYAAFVPSLMFPKSLLFGGGVERSNLLHYLPSADALEQRMTAQGIAHGRRLVAGADHMNDVATMSTRVLFHGGAESLSAAQSTQEIEAEALDIQTRLFTLMQQEVQRMAPSQDVPPNTIDLPIPIAVSGYFTDFYILPKSGLSDFAHYMGVAASAGLFVEIITPTILTACCKQLWRADQLDLDFSGFRHKRQVERFVDPKVVAMHPVKLSQYRTPEAQSEFLAMLDRAAAAPAQPGAHSSDDSLMVEFGAGWNAAELWGTWSSAQRATLSIGVPPNGTAVLVLRLPVHADMPHMTGYVEVAGRSPQPFAATMRAPEVEVVLEGLVPDERSMASLVICCDDLVRPIDLKPDSTDTRTLGVALLRRA